MCQFDFDAHKSLSGSTLNDIQVAIRKADEKAHLGVYKVCKTTAGLILVLPEYSASVRKDIAEVVYDTSSGYAFAVN
jgi:hypothetical protein